jgi:tight adherence protein B
MDIRGVLTLFVIGSIVIGGWWWWRRMVLRLAAQERVMQDAEGGERPRPSQIARNVYPPRHRMIPAVVGIVTGLGLRYGADLPLPVAAATGLMVGVLGYLVETIVAGNRLTRIETQLAEAIDLMVGALQAGLSLSRALETARQESALPLRKYLDNLVRKIRLGEDPASAVRELGETIPLETFQLFSLTLSAQWWTGGSLASTLAGVGRTIRDRIELTRRIRTQGVEAKASVIGVLAISYALALIMWRANPEPIEEFFASDIGATFAGAAMGLQAVGIMWINRISQVKF